MTSIQSLGHEEKDSSSSQADATVSSHSSAPIAPVGIIKKPVIVPLPTSLRCLQPLYKVATGYHTNLQNGMRLTLQSLAHAFVCVESSLEIIKEFKSIENIPLPQILSADDINKSLNDADDGEQSNQRRKIVATFQDMRVSLEEEISRQPDFNFDVFKKLYVRAKEDIRTDIILSMAVYYRDRGDKEFSTINAGCSNPQLCKRRAGQFYHSAAIFFQNLILQCHEMNKSTGSDSANDNTSHLTEQNLYYNKLLGNFNNCREKIKLCTDNEHQNLILEQFLFPKNAAGSIEAPSSASPYYKINHTTIFSDYENCDNGKVVGEGGYGSVFVVRHKKTGTEFACKKISTLNMDLKKLGRLHREIAILKQVDHPNIVRLHAVYYDSECVYLVMELCNVGDLVSFLIDKIGRPLLEQEAKRLLTDMIISIRYLHEHNIMHCDIKLENFVLHCDPTTLSMFPSLSNQSNGSDASQRSQQGHNTSTSNNFFSLMRQHENKAQITQCISQLVIKLTDFGLSKYSDEYDVPVLQGSVPYISPEVFNQEKYTKKCDIWSLGVAAFIMLTGKMPFKGSTASEVEASITRDDVTFPHRLSSTAIDFLKRFLDKNPQSRISLDDALVHPFLGDHSSSSHVDNGNKYVNFQLSSSDLRHVSTMTNTSMASGTSASSSGSHHHDSLMTSDLNGPPTPRIESIHSHDQPSNDDFSCNMSTASGKSDASDWLQIAESLRSYWSMCKFNQVLCKAVAFSLKPAQISDLRSIFNKIDTDRNGCVSMDELKSILRSNCENYAAEIEQSEEFQALSRDNAEISYSDFIAAALVKRVCLDESQLLMTFERLDQDRIGHLSYDAIRRAIGDKMTPEEVKDMMSALDKDGNGEIDYHEFLQHWRKLTIKRDKTPHYHRLFRKAMNVFKAINRFKTSKKTAIDPNLRHEKVAAANASATDTPMKQNQDHEDNRTRSSSDSVVRHISSSSEIATEVDELSDTAPRENSFYRCNSNASAAELEVKGYFFRVASISYDDDADDAIAAPMTETRYDRWTRIDGSMVPSNKRKFDGNSDQDPPTSHRRVSFRMP